MPLTSSSTIDEIKAAYVDNADYDTSDSASKATAFIQACRILLLKMPLAQTVGGGVSTTFTTAMIRQELEQARTYMFTRQGSGARYFATDEFRGVAGDDIILSPDPGGG